MQAERLEKVLKIHEGFEKYPYECTEGKLTIGIGRNIEDKGFTKSERHSICEGISQEMFLSYLVQFGITEEQAAMLLGNDIKDSQKYLQSILAEDKYNNLSEIRKEVLLDMIFNLGPTTFQQFSKMIAKIYQDKPAGVAQEMLNSTWADQVGQRAVDLAFSYLDDNWIIKGSKNWL